jgi:hypothetical protein
MSIKNMLTAALFKRDDAGRTVMYPNGAMGRGYVVPDTATEERMRRRFLWLIVGSGLFGGIGMQFLIIFYGQVASWGGKPWAIAIGALVAFAVGYRLAVRGMVRGMTLSAQRMGMVEAFRRQAEVMPRWYLWFIAVYAPLAVVGCAIWMLMDGSMLSRVIGATGILLFSVVSIQATQGLKHRAQLAAPRT